MNQLDHRFRVLDELNAPDLTSEIERRAQGPEPSATWPSGRRRLVAASVAICVFVLAAVFAWGILRHQRLGSQPIAPPTSHPSPNTVHALKPGWTRLPAPPEVRSGTSEVWDGQELLVWGGTASTTGDASPDGFALDPATSTWRRLPPAPIGRSDAQAVWTGTKAIFWGGVDARQDGVDGAAYDPATDSWRRLPPAPLSPRSGARLVWTGRELIVWGGGEDPKTASEGAAYDPATDTWRKLPDAPTGLNLFSADWTGTHVIMFGSFLGSQNNSATPHPVGVTFDPARDTWAEIPPANTLSPQATAAAWVGGRLIAYDYGLDAASFDPTTAAWTELPRAPGGASECYPDARAVQGELVAFYCGSVMTFDPAAGWSEVHGGLTEDTIPVNARSYRLWRFATLDASGNAVFFDAEGITLKNGAPCYGCAGSPTSLWAYRPLPPD